MTDDEMSAWPVGVPEEVRAFLRRAGGFTIGDGRHVFDFNLPDNHLPVANEYWPLQDASASWILHSDGSATTYYVDIDPESGAWGRIFSFWEEPYARLVAPGFLSWVGNLVMGVDSALEAARSTGTAVGPAFSDWLFNSDDSLSRHPSAGAEPLPVPVARTSGDTEIAEVAARLPDDAFLADLRAAVYPTEVPFADVLPIGETVTYSHFHGGGFLAATLVPDL
ncbi:SMI1/KNR4 family protein [Actinomadura craniellae]|nr:SMI1/KNR4 family protein [Actinomadura craniellae]